MGKGGYGLTYQEVYEMENLTIEAKAIYGMLCSYAGSKAMAYPSVDFICDKLKMALKGVLGILRGVANLVFSIFKTPVNEVIALFNAMGQTIVKAINNLIDGLNHIKVPDWVPGIGGKGINLSHANFRRVPYLAQGAVIPAGNPFLAVLGDQTRGNNLEMPENLLRKIVSEESGKGTGMIKLVVNLDSRTVLERLINTAKEMQMSNGQNVFELGR